MIEARGLVEAYVKRRLTAAESAAFEAHYFECDQCFEDVQAMERFVAGMRQAVDRGSLDGAEPVRRPWLMPAFAFATAACLLLAAALSYMTFVRMPGREAQLARAMDEVHRNQARYDVRADAGARGATGASDG